eukprot:5933160-Amphidinium_carterae.3
MAAADAIDMGVLVKEILPEIDTCEVSATLARDVFSSGLSCRIKLTVLIDAKSVFDIIESVQAKLPAEKSQLVNVAWLRELVQSDVVHTLLWVDTRDMLADALTKGSIGREALDLAMTGTVQMKHPVQECGRNAVDSAQSKKSTPSTSAADMLLP